MNAERDTRDRMGLREALSVDQLLKKTVLKFAGISTLGMGGVMGIFEILNRSPEDELNPTRIATQVSISGLLFGVISTLGYLGITAYQRGWGKGRNSLTINPIEMRAK